MAPSPPTVASIQTGQCHENDPASLVIVCAPSALSKMMGSLHPAGALYEKPVNIRRARDAHAAFIEMLGRKGANVRDVRDILTERVNWSVGDRIALENLAFTCLTYVFNDPQTSDDETCASFASAKNPHSPHPKDPAETTNHHAAEYYVSDQYKRMVIEEMGQQQLVDIIFTNPTVTVSPSTRDTGFTASYQFHPLCNIVFVRDQQITTRKGIVMASLRAKQRQKEVDIMEFCFKKLGLNVIGRVPYPATLEGGDFFPAGENLSLIGIGPRSNWAAVKYLLEGDLIGTERVAVVKDQFEQKQERMHLDTVFNILGTDCCLMLEQMMGADSPTRRVVDEYMYKSSYSPNSPDLGHAVGSYVLSRREVEFSQYIRDQGYSIITVSHEEQLNYGCNVLNLGNGNIISIEKNTARRIASSSDFKGTVEFLDFRPVTTMYGGVHCASQVVIRGSGCPVLPSPKRIRHTENNTIPATTFTDDHESASSE